VQMCTTCANVTLELSADVRDLIRSFGTLVR